MCVKVVYERVCVCVRARYHITPARELQFGAMTVSTRKSRTFTIDNVTTKFEIRFNLSATPIDMDASVVVPSASTTKADKKK